MNIQEKINTLRKEDKGKADQLESILAIADQLTSATSAKAKKLRDVASMVDADTARALLAQADQLERPAIDIHEAIDAIASQGADVAAIFATGIRTYTHRVLYHAVNQKDS